jgi:hypothetical protein
MFTFGKHLSIRNSLFSGYRLSERKYLIADTIILDTSQVHLFKNVCNGQNFGDPKIKTDKYNNAKHKHEVERKKNYSNKRLMNSERKLILIKRKTYVQQLGTYNRAIFTLRFSIVHQLLFSDIV